MESERRKRHEHIKDSNVVAEVARISDAELSAGSTGNPGQGVRILHGTADLGTVRILDPPLEHWEPGKCDPAFHLPGGVHGNPNLAPDCRLLAPGTYRENLIIPENKTTISA